MDRSIEGPDEPRKVPEPAFIPDWLTEFQCPNAKPIPEEPKRPLKLIKGVYRWLR